MIKIVLLIRWIVNKNVTIVKKVQWKYEEYIISEQHKKMYVNFTLCALHYPKLAVKW